MAEQQWNPRRERDVATGEQARAWTRASDRVVQLTRELAIVRRSKAGIEANAAKRGRDPRADSNYRQLAADELRLDEDLVTAQDALEAATQALAAGQCGWLGPTLPRLYEHLDAGAVATVQALEAAGAALTAYARDRAVFAELAPQSAHPPDLGGLVANHLARVAETLRGWLGRADRSLLNGGVVVRRCEKWPEVPVGHRLRPQVAALEQRLACYTAADRFVLPRPDAELGQRFGRIVIVGDVVTPPSPDLVSPAELEAWRVAQGLADLPAESAEVTPP